MVRRTPVRPKHIDSAGETDDLGWDPESATWTLRGYFGSPSPVNETLGVGEVRLLSTPNAQWMKKSDPRKVIPLN